MTGTVLAPAGVGRSQGRSQPRATALVLAALMLFSAGASLLVFHAVFPHGSLNNDEGVYLLQARALAHGHLFLDLTAQPRAVQPWFYAVTDHGLVPKYIPVVAGALALGLLLTGSIAPVLAVLAAALPLSTYALGREVGLTRPQGLLAAGLVALSPFAVVQSALSLSYLPFTLLLSLCWLLLLRVAAGRSRGWEAPLLGLLAVVAGCVRPLDAAVLLALPALHLVRAVHRTGRTRAVVVAVLLGAAPALLALLAYDAAATGSALRLPFGLLEPADALGYGQRKLFPEDVPHSFGPAQGLEAARRHFVLGPLRWFLLGWLVVPAALLSLRDRGRQAARRRLLTVSALLLVVLYCAFWGPYNASLLWGGTRVVGPIYAFVLLVPLVLAAVPVLTALGRRTPVLLALAVALSLVPNLQQTRASVVQGRTDSRRIAQVLGAVRAARPTSPVLLDVDPPYLGHPVSALQNVPGETARYALSADLVPGPELAADPPLLLQTPGDIYRPGFPLSFALKRQQLTSGPRLSLLVSFAGTAPGDVLVVEHAGHPTACPAGPSARLLLAPAMAVGGCAGAFVPAGWYREPYRRCPDENCLSVAYYRPGPAGSRGAKRLAYRKLAVGTGPDGLLLLTDARTLTSQGADYVTVTP